jgi:uncharacterized protein
MPNRLAGETSPYLLQHQDNPVDWYPWGREALDRAKAEDKPIFLSIGYSACHWCHVMAHESFEDAGIAALLNERFVCIKVDREERPDLDQIYMDAVQRMTQHGGWPMSMFLTPDLRPFYGGTYWPPQPRMGMPGFAQIAAAVAEAWRDRREQAEEMATRLTESLQESETDGTSGRKPTVDLLESAAAQLQRAFDYQNGGFGSRPKFPHPMGLQFLLRLAHRQRRDDLTQLVQLSLDRMARGGIYDHLAGGFARYSVDERWLVPHFEKMLYDNALLTGAYLDGFLVTGDPHHAAVVRETANYVLNYMTDATGGFHSAEDADSEGEEGKFYLWTTEEIHHVLGREAGERFCFVYDVSGPGNFEGRNILNLPKTLEQCAKLKGWELEPLREELAASRRKLLEVRDRRVRPGKDDKILVSWNALMIDSLARAASVLDEPRYQQAAAKAARFLLDQLRRPDGRMLHCWRAGRARFDAYLDDYAFLINALVSLYQTDFDEAWIESAVQLAETVLRHFADPAGGFYFTADDHEPLIVRNKELLESSVPSGNSMAATALWRLGRLCGNAEFLAAADGVVQLSADMMLRAPTAMGQMLIAADMQVGPMCEIVLLGDASQGDTARVLADLRHRYLPNHLVACRTPDRAGQPGALEKAFRGKTVLAAEPTVYICENFACQAPVSGVKAVLRAWNELTG